jgi:prephenate dehydrogenase
VADCEGEEAVFLNRVHRIGRKQQQRRIAAMKFAIVGAGSVGGTLGTAWAQKAGHGIFFGVRSPNSHKTQALLQVLDGARAGTAAEAAE